MNLLEAVIAKYLNAHDAGEELDRQELLASHPDIAQSLREFFEDHDRMLTRRHASNSLPQPPSPAWQQAQCIVTDRKTAELDATLDSTGNTANVQTQSGRYFGGYELLQEISRGGMGVVYKARQLRLNRTVALKMILSGELAGREEVLRFHSEAEAAAQLEHPGIVPIYEIGEHQGQHFYSMAFIDGQSLADRLRNGPLPPEHAAALLIKISQAVEFAHARGVIHRDLKPANILIDADGNPRVTDFGVAKRMEGNSELTRSGQILGTPAYMPPEQAAGQVGQIAPTTDVYSLGAILYATLTGRPPFEGSTPVETLMQVLEGEPTLPSKRQSGVPRSLESICMKCLEKNPNKRYASAEQLVEDLRRYLNNEPVAARPADIGQRLRRWCRREPALIAHWLGLLSILVTVQITFLLIGTDVVYYSYHTGVLLAWMAMAWVLQKLFNRPRLSEGAAIAWCVIDAVFMTTILKLAEPPIGPLLSGYALLIAACGFLLKAHLVMVTTGTVLACYLVLLAMCPELRERPHYCVMFALLMLVLGGVVTAQVRRVSRLNRHFENH